MCVKPSSCTVSTTEFIGTGLEWDFPWGFWLWRSARQSSSVMVMVAWRRWHKRWIRQRFTQWPETHVTCLIPCNLVLEHQPECLILYIPVVCYVIHDIHIANAFASTRLLYIMMVTMLLGEGPEFALWSNSKSCASVPPVHQPSGQILATRPATQMAQVETWWIVKRRCFVVQVGRILEVGFLTSQC